MPCSSVRPDSAGGLPTAGRSAVGLSGSASQESVAEALIDLCKNEFGAVSALINCAGIAEPARSSILSITRAEFNELLDVHLGTVFATCRAAAPRMVAAGGGSIVNTSSFAFLGDYGGTGYPAGKGAVNGLTMALAAELREHKVRVNAVCPGAKTRLSSGADYEQHIDTLRRRGILDDISAAAALEPAAPQYAAPIYAYLATDSSQHISGETFIAAGGFIGRFGRPSPAVLGFRDHRSAPPWSVGEIGRMLAADKP
jgi:NAD(P)-dependent dehydrogenase (short-subunit alcohol dehydrogenase family)